MRRAVIGVALLGALATAAPAAAQQPLDVRARERDALAAAGESARRPTAEMRRARSALERTLGAGAVLDVDPLTGTPRMLTQLDGALTGPQRGDLAEIAQRYVREHLPALGLTEADLGSLGTLQRVPVAGGEQVRWRQYDDGVPALDNELRVTVADDGAVVSVAGAPQHDLEAPGEPRLDAREALRAAGATAVPRVTAAAGGPQRRTWFAGGDRASLVVFGEGDRARLAWRVIHRASSQAVYDVVVDADSGRVLRRVNRVAHVQVFERHPGRTDRVTDSNLFAEGWLPAGATRLKGPNAHAWADLDDSPGLAPGTGEDVAPADYAFDGIIGRPGCTMSLPCSWDSDVFGSWEDNRPQTTQQAFYYVNRFHDWLRDEGFTTGSLEGDDPVLVQTLDGADGPNGVPDPAHRNNANMFTPPDGEPAVMQLYLFDTRDVHGGDDAAIVYHEYAHGLTNRLVTDGEGWGALTSPQAAAMGEGFSDYFAMDFLVAEGHQVDNAAAGELDVGEYTNGGGTPLRRQALDCPVGAAAAPRCGGGGFTYGDFGRIEGEPEVHGDGEIWGQTLWDLRTALGADAARALILEALSLAPPEPSFLDMRNAIVLADGGANPDTLWDVFAARGMGYFAGTTGSYDVNPAESFEPAPPAGGPRGTVAGRAVDFDNGRPVSGARVRVGGHDTLDAAGQPFPESFVGQTAADGAFSFELPVGTYEAVTVSAPAGHDAETLRDVAAPSAGHLVRLKRNWAAAAAGAAIQSVAGVATEYAGCRPEQAIDQQPGTGMSVDNDDSAPAIVVRLPRLVAVTAFAADPGNTCGDPAGSTTTGFAVAVSEDGASWHEAEYALGISAAHLRTALPVAMPGAGRVRFVRLRLLEAHDPEAPFIDFTDLSVYGNALPVARLSATTPVRTGQAVTFNAGASEDPDGTIAGYEWDFDGNGSIDRTTAGPTTSFAYAAAGSYPAAVTVVDDRGGRERVAGTITVTAPPSPPAPPPPAPPPPPPPPPPAFEDPRIVLPRSGSRGRVVVSVRCDQACFGPVRLTVDRRTARRLGLGRSRTIGKADVRLAQAGERRVTVRLTRKAQRALRRARMRTVRVTLSATVRDIGGRSASASRRVRIRR